MKIKDIQDILSRLGKELHHADDVDADTHETVQSMKDKAGQLHYAVAPDIDALLDHARTLETRFSADHPTLARLARELTDALAKMGI